MAPHFRFVVTVFHVHPTRGRKDVGSVVKANVSAKTEGVKDHWRAWHDAVASGETEPPVVILGDYQTTNGGENYQVCVYVFGKENLQSVLEPRIAKLAEKRRASKRRKVD